MPRFRELATPCSVDFLFEAPSAASLPLRHYIFLHFFLHSFTMSLSFWNTFRCCARAARTAGSKQQIRYSSPLSRHATSRRWQSTEAAAASTNPKIQGIVDQISQLTLLETADLVSSLKVCPVYSALACCVDQLIHLSLN